MTYKVSGYINRKGKEFHKEFKTLKKANKYLDSILCEYDVQVEDSFKEENVTKYICDDFTRFYVEEN